MVLQSGEVTRMNLVLSLVGSTTSKNSILQDILSGNIFQNRVAMSYNPPPPGRGRTSNQVIMFLSKGQSTEDHAEAIVPLNTLKQFRFPFKSNLPS